MAKNTLFMVMQYYPEGSLETFFSKRYYAQKPAPYGLGWENMAQLFKQMLEAVNHLISNGMVHGDIKQDQFFLDKDLNLVLGDFGCSWSTRGPDGTELRLDGQAALLEMRKGVGCVPAPEVRGRRYADKAMTFDTEKRPTLQQLFAKAESWSVGYLMYDILCQGTDRSVFAELAGVHAGGLKRPGYTYEAEELPPLPADVPAFLREPIVGLVQCWTDERLSAREAIEMLGAAGVARAHARVEQAEMLGAEERRKREQVERALAQRIQDVEREHDELVRIKDEEIVAKAGEAAADARAELVAANAQHDAAIALLRHEAQQVAAEQTRAAEQRDAAEQASQQQLERQKQVSDLPCSIRREGGQSLVIGGSIPCNIRREGV